jgi:phosphatidylglycerophosphatase C
MNNGIAFFDLDGTITQKDTFIDFIIYCRGKNYFILGILLLTPWIVLYLLKLFPNFRLKEMFFRYFLANYFSVDQLENIGKSYSNKRLPSIVYKEALKRIKWHKENNHKIIILTASSSIWLSDWCRLNELELIGTEFEKVGNKYTGKIIGKNCHGLQKMVIVDKILNETEFNLTYGYGDSEADKLFLYRLKNIDYRPEWIKHSFCNAPQY